MKTTSKPIAKPSVNPTVKPTVNPNATTSTNPTINPTAMPTTQPAVKPKSCISWSRQGKRADESLDRMVVMSLHPRNLILAPNNSVKVAAKNPEEKHQKMDSGSTKTEIQVDESKDVKPPAFGHDNDQ